VTNQALMELGAIICSPKKPKCGVCPLNALCSAHDDGVEESYPERKKPKEWLQVREELHCVVNSKNQVLLRQRAKGEWRAGLWDLLEKKPTGLGQLEKVGEIETRHVVTRHKITRLTHVWKVKAQKLIAAERASEKAAEQTKWVSIELTGESAGKNAEVDGDSPIAIGSALKKTWMGIRERYSL
jgi:adenine-specific DNA glycosylase